MKTIKVPAFIAALALLVLSCEVTVTNIQTYDVSGTAVNVRADRDDTTWGSVLRGTVVTLTDTTSGSVRTATVNSGGTFGWDGLPVGEYRMTAEKSGWAFVPRLIELTGRTLVLPDLLGYESTGNAIFIISEWKNEDVDVDSYLVIDDDNFLEESLNNTGKLATVSPTFPAFGTIALDRDITTEDIADGLPAVETIRIGANPFSPANGAADTTGLLKFYLHAESGTGELTGNSMVTTPIKDAQATVHVMQGTTHYGTFPVATETDETTVMVAVIKFAGSQFFVSSPANFGDGVFLNVK